METLTTSKTAAPGGPKLEHAQSEDVLRVQGLRKIFTSGAQRIAPLDGIDFTVERGEMISVMGASGAGKSTLLHILAALDTPTSGEVYFDGKSLQLLSEAELASYRNQAVGFVWQRHHLLPDFTAAENVAMPLLLRGKKPNQAYDAAAEWLGKSDWLAGQVNERESYQGEQQRVAIARALVSEPAVLLADEPTGDLDERNAETIFELMRSLHKSHGLTSILATHNISLARQTSRILVLQGGKIAPGAESVQVPADGLSRSFGIESVLGERG